ncbi:FeoC-like transcriptional regulator [Enterobacillus tribolii]|uniref:Probable [Fe-S]-dependent transcriptional repressor n=1 Tax=Enterobacillus tribolii TaxID=1487935 RepID=A0A370QTW1_9GAMM|nr:FeoC-like transcriptional regulator [Enterobacillus tribolii]MBW7981248.1 ferrous iron transporter C [Enterobacillus tribolii]RDK92689.1 ferrous iron transport protein C [Enterobacillus tribolii]
MTSLLQVRDAVALHGRVELRQLSRELSASPSMVKAMLERLEAMGSVEKVTEIDTGCLGGGCKGCPETERCEIEVYQIKTP